MSGGACDSGQAIGGAIGGSARARRGGRKVEGTPRSGQTQRGETLLSVLAVKLLLLFIVWKLQTIKYKNDDHVAQWLKTSRATSGRVR